MPIPIQEIVAKKASFTRDPDTRPADFREDVFRIEDEGEWIVHRIPDEYLTVPTKYDRLKKIPVQPTWHHKSCGQCGHIPGYSTAIFWVIRKLGLAYDDPKDQT
ncbi:MAG: heterodisulfide reductase subunit B, partial [Actinomycetota bacterium]